jgi:hypothetical protein
MLNIEYPMFNVEVKYRSRFGGFVIIAIQMVLLVDFFGLPGFGFGPCFSRCLASLLPLCLVAFSCLQHVAFFNFSA